MKWTPKEKDLIKTAKKKYKTRKLLTDLKEEEYLVYKKHITFLEEKIILPIIYIIWFSMFTINISYIFFA